MIVTTDTGPNHELFVKVLAQIEREPERWDQAAWNSDEDNSCSTAYCMAGWAAALTGHRFIRFGVVVGESPAWRVGAEALGISDDASGDLFDGTNTLNDLYRISADILGLDETVLRDKVTAAVSS